MLRRLLAERARRRRACDYALAVDAGSAVAAASACLARRSVTIEAIEVRAIGVGRTLRANRPARSRWGRGCRACDTAQRAPPGRIAFLSTCSGRRAGCRNGGIRRASLFVARLERAG